MLYGNNYQESFEIDRFLVQVYGGSNLPYAHNKSRYSENDNFDD